MRIVQKMKTCGLQFLFYEWCCVLIYFVKTKIFYWYLLNSFLDSQACVISINPLLKVYCLKKLKCDNCHLISGMEHQFSLS